MRSKRCVGNGKKYVQAQRKGQSYIPHAFGGLVSTSTILNETRGKIISGGIRGFNAPLLSRKDLNSAEVEPIRVSGNPIPQAVEKNKRGSNSEHLRFGFIRDEDLPAVLCRLENSANITDTPMSGPVVKKNTGFFCNVRQYNGTLKVRAHRCSGTINRTSQLDFEYIFNIGAARLYNRRSYAYPSTHTKSEYTQSSTGRPVACPQKPKTKIEMRKSMQHWEAGRMICQNGSRNSLNI